MQSIRIAGFLASYFLTGKKSSVEPKVKGPSQNSIFLKRERERSSDVSMHFPKEEYN